MWLSIFCCINGSQQDLFIVTLSDRQELSSGRKEADTDAYTTFLNSAISNILHINTNTGDHRRLPAQNQPKYYVQFHKWLTAGLV